MTFEKTQIQFFVMFSVHLSSWLVRRPHIPSVGVSPLLHAHATGTPAKPFNETGVKGAGSSLANAEDFIGLAGSSRSLLKLFKSPTKKNVQQQKSKVKYICLPTLKSYF